MLQKLITATKTSGSATKNRSHSVTGPTMGRAAARSFFSVFIPSPPKPFLHFPQRRKIHHPGNAAVFHPLCSSKDRPCRFWEVPRWKVSRCGPHFHLGGPL